MNSGPRQEILEALKEKHYRSWIPYEIKGVTIEIVPLPRDIPLLESQGYDPLTDTFSIRFRIEGERYENRLDEVISILEDDRGYIGGINIYGVRERGIQKIEVTVKKRLEDFLLAMKEKLEIAEDRSSAYKLLGRVDLNQRAINFLGELTEKSLEKLAIQPSLGY